MTPVTLLFKHPHARHRPERQGRGPHAWDVHDAGSLRRVERGNLRRVTKARTIRNKGADVKKILSLAAIAALAGLTACSVQAPEPAPAASGSAQGQDSAGSTPGSTAPGPASSAPAAPAAGGAKEACGLFNSLYAEYAAVPADDANGFEEIYLKAQDAQAGAAGDLEGLFAALALLSIDRSGKAETGGQADQESKDAVRDAVFANSGTCTAEGVTLRL